MMNIGTLVTFGIVYILMGLPLALVVTVNWKLVWPQLYRCVQPNLFFRGGWYGNINNFFITIQ